MKILWNEQLSERSFHEERVDEYLKMKNIFNDKLSRIMCYK